LKLAILDRDGVINQDSPDFIKSPEEWVPIPGSLDAIARLNHVGYRVIVATNQSGLRRRLLSVEDLSRIHERMHQQLAELGGAIEAVFFCPCIDRDQCECRKPSAGMFKEIASRLNVSLQDVPMVGDSSRDILAAQAVAGRPILVLTGNGRETMTRQDATADVEVYDDLAAVADMLIAEAEG
jgi:D-glycero-D-manno-heptose 1,7-bisphosphate phosphatase